MRLWVKGAAGLTAMALLLCTVPALGNGAEVLDQMEASQTELQTIVTDGGARLTEIADLLANPATDKATKKALKKERDQLKSAIKKAEKGLERFQMAIPALKDHDMKTFFKSAKKAVKDYRKVEKKGAKMTWAGWPLDGTGSQELATDLKNASQQSRDFVDATADGAEKALKKADKFNQQGTKLEGKGKFDKASLKFLAGLGKTQDLPTPVNGDHGAVVLRGLNGMPMNLGLAVAPYSPKQTCGECHDYDLATKGYHFDQGQQAVSDDYSVDNPDVPNYVLSDGMYGRW